MAAGPISFQCYSCHQVLKVGADKAGKRGKCPKCGTALTVPISSTTEPAPAPAAPAPPPAPAPRKPPPLPRQAVQSKPESVAPAPLRAEPVEEDLDEPMVAEPVDDDLEDEPPAQKRRRDEYEEEAYERPRGPGFTPGKRAKLGLLLVFIAFCVVGGAFAADLIAYIIFSVQMIGGLTGSRGGGGDPQSAIVLWRIGAILASAGSLTAIAGYVFCMIGPNKRGSMGIAIATLVVAAIGLVISIIFKLLPLFREHFLMGASDSSGSVFFPWFMWLLTQLLFSAEIILFPLYTRALALARKKYWVADASSRVMLFSIGYTAARVLGFIVIYISTKSPGRAWGWIFLILLWVGNGLYIPQLIQYLLLLWRTRDIVKK